MKKAVLSFLLVSSFFSFSIANNSLTLHKNSFHESAQPEKLAFVKNMLWVIETNLTRQFEEVGIDYLPSICISEPTPASNTLEAVQKRTSGGISVVEESSSLSGGVPCTSTPGCIGGNVFEDFNCNGIDDLTEPGVQGVEIEVYDCDNNLVGTVSSDNQGDWQVCGLTDGTAYRVEHILPAGIASWATPTHVGTDNCSDIQFLTSPACTKFSVSSPNDYCETNPMLATTCFVTGDPLTGSGTAASMAALVAFDNNSTGNGTSTGTDPATYVANAGEVGSVWGAAWNPNDKHLFLSAFVKRHVGIGSLGEGGIYQIDYSTGVPVVSNWLDVSSLGVNVGIVGTGATPADRNVNRGLIDDASAGSTDPDAYAKVGKVGIGDMDLSADGSLLYFTNLYDQRIYAIDVSTKTIVGTYSFPINECTNGTLRPFALKFHKGNLYAGAVCDAANGTDTDLSAFVYRLDGALLTQVFSTSLDYSKGSAISMVSSAGCFNNTGWYPWADTPPSPCASDNFFVYPTPVLSDIEFDNNGDMILAFMDRTSHQIGWYNGSLTDIGANWRVVVGGDILRVHDNNGIYVLENNATAGGTTTSGMNNGEGVGGGEYYYEDKLEPSHSETTMGSLALIKGNEDVILTAMDPFGTGAETGGINWFNNTTGAAVKTGYYIYAGATSFGKAAGLGDLETLCEPAPLEIGNYVWCDSIENGIQDACERGLSDIVVQLYDRNGVLVGQDITVNGQYYFNQYNVDTTGITVTAGTASPNTTWSGMSYSTQYFIVYGAGQFAGDKFAIGEEFYGVMVSANVGSNDNIDSDVDGSFLTSGSLGSRPNGLPYIDMTTAAMGCGDHKYDFGLTCPIPVYSLGNQVFSDTNNSGDLNAGEMGIDGVQLTLLNADGSIYDSDPNTPGIQADTVTTANGGYYRFDGLLAGMYIVQVIDDNFASGATLEHFATSTGMNQEANPNDDIDINDNGLDTPVMGAIQSDIVTLGNPEPTGETDEPMTYDPSSVTGIAAADDFSNLTVDFGFRPVCSVTITSTAQSSCNNNGTVPNEMDDYFTVTVNATGVNGGTQYEVVLGANPDGTGGMTVGTETYGTPFTIGDGTNGATGIFAANGLAQYTITVRDVNENTCFNSFVTNAVMPCSSTPLGGAGYDWGDLPDGTAGVGAMDYQTTLANNGPSHYIIPELQIGSSVDDELDGQPSTDAMGDGVDEDGFVFSSNIDLVPGTTISLPLDLSNTTGNTAHFEMWIDWNGDGDFDDAGEMIADLSDDSMGDFGQTYLTFMIPENATINQLLGVRARLGNTDNMTPNGPVEYGEVEDYLIQLDCPTPKCLPSTVQVKRGQNG